MYILLGAHGTGKSSLLKYLNQQRRDYFTTDGFSRPIRKVFKKHYDPILEQQIIDELTEWAFLNYLQHDKIISTRSILDLYLYKKELFNTTNYYYLNTFINNINKINKIFYLPIEFELEDDGMRYNKSLQTSIDKEIKNLIDNYFEIKSKIIVLNGSIEERYNQMCNYLI